jgi:hypothetical protein
MSAGTKKAKDLVYADMNRNVEMEFTYENADWVREFQGRIVMITFKKNGEVRVRLSSSADMSFEPDDDIFFV